MPTLFRDALQKFNPHHDEQGRFATAAGGSRATASDVRDGDFEAELVAGTTDYWTSGSNIASIWVTHAGAARMVAHSHGGVALPSKPQRADDGDVMETVATLMQAGHMRVTVGRSGLYIEAAAAPTPAQRATLTDLMNVRYNGVPELTTMDLVDRTPTRFTFASKELPYMRAAKVLRVMEELFRERLASGVVEKFNPHHDASNGQFTTGPGGARASAVAGQWSQQLTNIAPDHAVLRTKTFDKAREALRTVDTDYEYAVVGSGGKVALAVAGEESSVTFTEEQLGTMRGQTLIHNHPNGTALSPPDLHLAVSSRLASIEAISSHRTVKTDFVLDTSALYDALKTRWPKMSDKMLGRAAQMAYEHQISSVRRVSQASYDAAMKKYNPYGDYARQETVRTEYEHMLVYEALVRTLSDFKVPTDALRVTPPVKTPMGWRVSTPTTMREKPPVVRKPRKRKTVEKRLVPGFHDDGSFTLDDRMPRRYEGEVLKFNPHHDPENGQFTTGPRGVGAKPRMDDLIEGGWSNTLFDTDPTGDRVGELMTQNRNRANAWEAAMERAISDGSITPEAAQAAGFSGSGSAEWKPLPSVLYHATTDLANVEQQGLRASGELDTKTPAGLGGGSSTLVSFTESETIAHQIVDATLELRALLRGERTLDDMIAEAKTQGYWDTLRSTFKDEWINDETFDNVRRGTIARPAGNPFSPIVVRPWTEDERMDTMRALNDRFAMAREANGGPVFPLWWSPNLAAIRDLNPQNVGVVAVHPRAGSRGLVLNALGEWRTSSGAHLGKPSVVSVAKFNPHHDARGRFATGPSGGGPRLFASVLEPTRITLRPRAAATTSSDDAVLAAFREVDARAAQRNPFDERELLFGDGEGVPMGALSYGTLRADDQYDGSPPALYGETLRAVTPGGGSTVLRTLLEVADKHNVPVIIFAKRFGPKGKGKTQRALVQWYKKWGFTVEHGYGGSRDDDYHAEGVEMIRVPNTPMPAPKARRVYKALTRLSFAMRAVLREPVPRRPYHRAVAKFNPYHDDLGRFTTSEGVIYSARERERDGSPRMVSSERHGPAEEWAFPDRQMQLGEVPNVRREAPPFPTSRATRRRMAREGRTTHTTSAEAHRAMLKIQHSEYAQRDGVDALVDTTTEVARLHDRDGRPLLEFGGLQEASVSPDRALGFDAVIDDAVVMTHNHPNRYMGEQEQPLAEYGEEQGLSEGDVWWGMAHQLPMIRAVWRDESVVDARDLYGYPTRAVQQMRSQTLYNPTHSVTGLRRAAAVMTRWLQEDDARRDAGDWNGRGTSVMQYQGAAFLDHLQRDDYAKARELLAKAVFSHLGNSERSAYNRHLTITDPVLRAMGFRLWSRKNATGYRTVPRASATLFEKLRAVWSNVVAKYDPNQPRDPEGQWVAVGQGELFADVAERGRAWEAANPRTWQPDDGWMDVDQDKDLIDTPEKYAAFLAHYKATETEFDGKHLLVDGDTTYVVSFDDMPPANVDMETVADFVEGYDITDAVIQAQEEFNTDFWAKFGVSTLYHGTDPENLQDILDNGIESRDEKRGPNNRHIGGAVFMHPETDLPSGYGEGILEIDMAAWRKDIERGAADAPQWRVQREPTPVEIELRANLAYQLGVEDYQPEDYSGEDPETVIMHGYVPPKYIRVHESPSMRRRR